MRNIVTKRDEAVRMFYAGVPRKNIAKELDVSYCSIQKWLMGMSAAEPVRFLPKSLLEDWDRTTKQLRRALHVSNR